MNKIVKVMMGALFLFSTTCLIGQPNFTPPSGGNFASNRTGIGIQWLNTFADAVKESKETHKPILILFTGTSWCPACMKLEREVLNHPQFAADVAQRFIFLKAEFTEYNAAAVANSPFKPLLDQYGIQTFPTMVIVDTDGKRLFVVNYQMGGARAYAQELLGRLQQFGNQMPQADQAAPSSNQAPNKAPQTNVNLNPKNDPKMDNEGYYKP